MVKLAVKEMMQISVIGNNNSGFSLIELLVVLVIMGVSFAMVTLSIHVADPSTLEGDAKRLVATINQAHDLEDLSGSPIWMTINCEQWRFFDTSSGTQQPMNKEEVAGGEFKSQLKSITINETEMGCTQEGSLKLVINDDPSPTKLILTTDKQSLIIASDSLDRFSIQ
ncbi:hypothetical protein FERRO_12590 [Ferrovum sp. JA12]|uniref:prepilin-type N-terminal cleavage/methylation domain-containing protein n=1 Tax=Ferrovum sp. JA12 TaxID=1356299 RepID=UPI000712651C|nr:prepilin-type N-terminal cleavage/methylation domain-containing protein [Ferrovum sp. JA12]KRH78278.1 hypothetical protein FERRO_12590 [Ferrovum sp. JA12]